MAFDPGEIIHEFDPAGAKRAFPYGPLVVGPDGYFYCGNEVDYGVMRFDPWDAGAWTYYGRTDEMSDYPASPSFGPDGALYAGSIFAPEVYPAALSQQAVQTADGAVWWHDGSSLFRATVSGGVDSYSFTDSNTPWHDPANPNRVLMREGSPFTALASFGWNGSAITKVSPAPCSENIDVWLAAISHDGNNGLLHARNGSVNYWQRTAGPGRALAGPNSARSHARLRLQPRAGL